MNGSTDFERHIKFIPIGNDEHLNKYNQSVIIGLWRQGNPDAIICAITNVKLSLVFQTIKLYQETL